MRRKFRWPPKALLCTSALLSCTSCDGWEIVRKGDSQPTDEAFGLKLMAMESCPLPPHLNPKNVSILSYRVRLTGNHSSGVPANYFYASLLTTDGERYLSNYYGCRPLLSAEPLVPGANAEGFVNFAVPPSKIPHKLVYAPVLLDRPDAESTEMIVLDASSAAPKPL